MSHSAELYLSKIEKQTSNSKTHEKVKHLNSTVLDEIDHQIFQSKIVIPEHEKKLKLRPTPDQHEQELSKIDGKYNEIKLKKKVLLDELRAVETMETAIKANMSTLKDSTVSSHISKQSKFKSQFTQQEIAKIKEIYKNQKKYQRKLDAKLKKYQENLELYKKQQEQEEKEKHRKLCMQKHQERQKYIKEIQIRNKQREETLKQQREAITEIQNKQKLFQKLQDSFLKEKQLESEELKRKLEQHKKKRQFSFEEMKRHQEVYMEKKKAKDQQREENVRNFKNVNETKFPCLFMDKIKEQDERAALQEEQRRQLIRNNAERKTAYAEQVRKQLHNKIKTMSESKLSSIKEVKTEPKFLNTPQKYHEGTKYMREVNEKIAKLPRKKLQKTIQGDEKPKFKNYLAELKNQDPEKKREIKENSVSNITNSVVKIAAKENLTAGSLTKTVKAKLDLITKLQSMQN